MNKQYNSRLILIFPFISTIIVFIHFWIIQEFIDYYKSNNLNPNYSILSNSTIISILGNIFMLLCGFVLYGSIRDKDFKNDRIIIIIYLTCFIMLLILSIVNIYKNISYFL